MTTCGTVLLFLRGSLHRPRHLFECRRGQHAVLVLLLSVFAFHLLWVTPSALASDRPEFYLALRLIEEQDSASAALEFRRLALMVDRPQGRAGFFWASAHQYMEANRLGVAEQMLDLSEDAWPQLDQPALLLRGEVARKRNDLGSARFYWSTLMRSDPDLEVDHFIRRRLAGIHIQENQLESARDVLAGLPEEQAAEAIEAVHRFEQGRDKRPWLGGLLGMIPGMGYAYAGEYANAFRSALLNAIFIYGMVDTAQNDHWGGFAVITFFQMTWYTGSIYGGIDASHRYNQQRLNNAVDRVQGDASFLPDWPRLPLVELRFQF